MIRNLLRQGALVQYYDPFVPVLDEFGLKSVAVADAPPADRLRRRGDRHGALQRRLPRVVMHAPLVVDLRNATAGIPASGTVWKL